MSANAEVSGRTVFVVVGVLLVVVAGGIGAIVGASGEARAVPMDLGVVSFPMTPGSMAVFGMVVTAGTLALLFGLVSVAARYDEE